MVQNEENQNTTDYVDFGIMFEKLIEKHKNDDNYYLIKDYPKIFSLITNIASDKNSEGNIKMIMNSAISYFVMTIDTISEKEFGIKGYIDDFFICLYALNALLEYDQKQGEYLISKHWKLNEDYRDYIHNKYLQLVGMLDSKLIKDVLSCSGVGYIEEKMLLMKNPKTYSEKKIRSLERKLEYLLYLFFNQTVMNNEARKEIEQQIFGTDAFMEFARKVDLLSKTDNNFITTKNNIHLMMGIEESIKKAKLRRIFK